MIKRPVVPNPPQFKEGRWVSDSDEIGQEDDHSEDYEDVYSPQEKLLVDDDGIEQIDLNG